MIGDVWLEKDKNNKVYLCIDLGNGVIFKKEINKNVKNKIQTKTDR